MSHGCALNILLSKYYFFSILQHRKNSIFQYFCISKLQYIKIAVFQSFLISESEQSPKLYRQEATEQGLIFNMLSGAPRAVGCSETTVFTIFILVWFNMGNEDAVFKKMVFGP